MSITTEQIAALRKVTSPSVANAIETFKVRLREEGNVASSIRCLFPELGPMVGHAVTCVIRAEHGPIDPTRDCLPAGQGAGGVHDIASCAEIVERVMREARETIERLGGLL